MFDVQSAQNQIQKNELENEILQTKIEFWEKMTTEEENGDFGFTDYRIDYVISHLKGFTGPISEKEQHVIDAFITKIESLETQLYALA